MTINDQVRILERFNEKVDRLRQSGFAEESRLGGAIVEWRKGLGWDGIHIGPSDNTLHATVLTLRFFLQSNENTSLANMDKLYSNSNIEPQVAMKFHDVRDQINSYLDGPSNLSISEEGPMTHRQILELFIYGDLAHANDATKEANFRAVSKTAFFPLFQDDFTKTLLLLMSALNELQTVNCTALQQLRLDGKPTCPQ